MRIFRVLLLACVSICAFADQTDPKPSCSVAVWGRAPQLNAFDSEDLDFFQWRAERLQREIGHWLSDPVHYNKAMAPALGFELDEAFAGVPGSSVYKTRLQSLFRVTQRWVELVRFMRLFRAPLVRSEADFTRAQLTELWAHCEEQASRPLSAAAIQSNQSEDQVREMALGLVHQVQIPYTLRSLIQTHIAVMDFYQLPLATGLLDLVNDVNAAYNDRS